MRPFFQRLLWIAQRRGKEDELREELEFHLEEEAAGFEADGMTDGDARCAARRGLGNVALVQEDTRAAWGWLVLEQFLQDLRYAARTMMQNRAFTALAV